MSEKRKKLICLIYGIVQSLLTVGCGIALIMGCLAIYNGGEGTYSREAVATQFQKILIPVVLFLAGVVTGMILSLCLPSEAKKRKGEVDPKVTLNRIMARVNLSSCPVELTAAMKKEQKLRLVLRILATAVCVVVAIPCVIYFFDLSHFDDIGTGLTEDILAVMKRVIPATAVGLSAWVTVVYACRAGLKRETDLAKEALKVAPLKEKATPPTVSEDKKARTLWIVRGVICVVAIVFVVLGIFNGSMNDVLQKAIRICTECIGLG